MSAFVFDACELLPERRQLRIGGVPVQLGSRAFDVLLALVERAGQLVTKEALLNLVWPGMVVEEANVQVQISTLRKLIGPQAIATIPGRGYRFTAQLRTAEPAGGEAQQGQGRAELLRQSRPQPQPQHQYQHQPLPLPGASLAADEPPGDVRLGTATPAWHLHPGTQRESVLPTPPVAEQAMQSAPSEPPPVHLPEPRTPFIGRVSSLARCAELLAQRRLLTLIGIGGCGKTRLALQLAHQLAQQPAHQLAHQPAHQLAHQPAHQADVPPQAQGLCYPGGTWFVDLAPVADGPGVVAAVAEALDVREDPEVPTIDLLAARLGHQRILLVLDNCEHVVTAASTLCDRLLSQCPGLTLLATSRVVLHVDGEQVYPVQPLTLPADPSADELAGSEAVQLFVSRARLACPDLEWTESQQAAVGTLCHRLEGLPLAIELAAARAGVLSVADMEAGLNDRFRFLAATGRPSSRHQTLEMALQWSYVHLTEAEQRAFRWLSVFAGGWTLASAAAVCGLQDTMAALDLLGSLNDKSLLVVDRRPPETRYGMLETVREFALARLQDSDDAGAARHAHLQWVMALVAQAAPALQGPAQGEWMARLRREQENIVAAHLGCLQQGLAGEGEALTLAAQMSRYWLNSAQLERGYRFTTDALTHAGPFAAPLQVCRALAAVGTIAFRMGRYDECLEASARGLAMARELADTTEIAAALVLRTKGLHAVGQDGLALQCAAESCDAARALGMTTRLSAALNNLGEIHRGLGQVAAAQGCYEEAIEITRQLGYAGGTFVSLCNLVRLSISAGRLESAAVRLLEGVALWEASGMKAMAKDLLECSAGLAACCADATAAARFLGAAQARLDEAGIRRERVDEDFLAPLMNDARGRLGGDLFDRTQADGKALTFQAAMDEVKAWLLDNAAA